MTHLGLEQFRDQLRQRYERLHDTEPTLFHLAHRQFWDWLESQSMGRVLLSQFEQKLEKWNLDCRQTAEWLVQGDQRANIGNMAKPKRRLSLAWAVVQQCRQPTFQDEPLPQRELNAAERIYLTFHKHALNWGTSREREVILWRLFLQSFIEPLYFELLDNTDEQLLLRHLLSRYAQRSALFDRDSLHDTWEETRPARKGEHVLAQNMYRYLFDHHLTFAVEPKTDAGRTDLLALDDEENYVVEVKVFTDNDEPASVPNWVSQLHAYAEDHDSASAFLVVFNTQGRQIRLPSQVTTAEFGGLGGRQRVYDFVVVDICPNHPSASKRKKLAPICVGVDNLVE
jgi:hypothetical protein